jgi:hypothetical protein
VARGFRPPRAALLDAERRVVQDRPLEFLRAPGCDAPQGRRLARPGHGRASRPRSRRESAGASGTRNSRSGSRPGEP